jgi:signal transduction histidine kinase
VQLTSAALKIDEVRTVAVVVTDLTHERIERGLRESNRLKDEFLATLSHELRTPLNVILGWTRMLMSDHLPEKTRRHAFELIDRNARAQAQLVNDLVDMSRITAGKLRLELESLPLIPVLEAALESIRPAAQAKNLTIETSWNVRDAVVLADATRLQQVLWNLFSNAVKFTPSGGRIVVSCALADDRTVISVSDTGPGIPADKQGAIFEPFVQLGRNLTSPHEGTGLGLAISRDLARAMGGDITVDSVVDEGSTFKLELPRAAGPA